jgi:molecular chaperone DnaJ
MDEYYKILGVSPDADDAEIENAYQTLKAKYSRERFEDGEVGNNAAKNLTKLNEAYDEIIESRKYVSNQNKNNSYGTYDDVSNAIKKGDLNHAQDLLDGMSDRDAEWHYLESVVFYKKNWMNESKRQLEIAMDKDPKNVKYKEAYEKLCTKMHNAEARFTSGNVNYNNGPNGYDDRQMGGDGCLDICATTCCVNMLCNMCCR